MFHEEGESAKSSSAPIRKQFGREAFDSRKKVSLGFQNVLLSHKENNIFGDCLVVPHKD